MQLLRNFTSARLTHLVLLLLAFVTPASARSVVDATGRTVELPDRVERVMPAGPPAAVLVYTLAPERLIGWPHAPNSEARAEPARRGMAGASSVGPRRQGSIGTSASRAARRHSRLWLDITAVCRARNNDPTSDRDSRSPAGWKARAHTGNLPPAWGDPRNPGEGWRSRARGRTPARDHRPESRRAVSSRADPSLLRP